MAEYWCAASRLNDLDRVLERLTKLARKLGVTPPSYSVVDRRWEERTVNGWQYPVELVCVDIVDTDLRLEGDWQLLAVIDHDTGLVRTVPSAPEGTVAQYQDCEPTCDHCGTTRQRNKTMVVVNSAGDRKRVGGQCLKDYVGHRTSLTWAVLAEWTALLTFDDDWQSLSSRREASVGEVVVAATALLQHYQYTAQGGTKSDVLLYLGISLPTTPLEIAHRNTLRAQCPITDDVYVLASEALDYCANNDDQSNFALNLRAVARHADRTTKAVGLACYIPEAYKRYKAAQCEQARQALLPTAPAPYGRRTVVGEVVGVSWKYDDYRGVDVKKLTVRDDTGFRVLFTEPSNVCADKGDRISVSVDIQQRSTRDETFGFGKRPTRATVLTTTLDTADSTPVDTADVVTDPADEVLL